MRPSQKLLIILCCWFAIGTLSTVMLLFTSSDFLVSLQSLLQQFWLVSGGVLLVALIIDWLACQQLKNRFKVERVINQNLAVGVNTKVSLTIHHPFKRHARIFIADYIPNESKAPKSKQWVDLKEGQFSTITYQFRPIERGNFDFPCTQILFTSSLGLWQKSIRCQNFQTVKVYPNFKSVSDYTLLAIDHHTSRIGIKLKPRRGEGLTFHQLRHYRPGDLMRQIDWKATSRSKKLISKEYQDERDQQVVFLMDCGRRMRSKDGLLSHFDVSLNAALLMGYVALRQGDAVGLMTFAGQQRQLAPMKGGAQLNTLLDTVYDLEPSLSAPDYLDIAKKVKQSIHKRSLIVILTNVNDEHFDNLKAAARLMQQKHLVLVANLREQVLDTLLEKPIHQFNDALTYLGNLRYRQKRDETQRALLAKHLMCIDTTPDYLAPSLVNKYFDVKRGGIL